jgi:hypothetical protein
MKYLLAIIWKGEIVTRRRYCLGISVERLNKTKENPGQATNAVVGVPSRKPPSNKACVKPLHQPV